jgi:type III pantothenate kinase
MNLIIDIGNSRIKTALFDKNQIIDLKIHSNYPEISSFINSLKINYAEQCIVSATGTFKIQLRKLLEEKLTNFIELNGNTPLPYNNLYISKETQGPDRIAAIAGAQLQFPYQNILVIDAGTAITFDFIDTTGNYLGGNISPGLEMRFKALHTFTKKLPLLSKTESKNFLGKTTQEAIVSGVQNSMVFEIEEYIATISSNYENLRTIITGGDADFFANKLKSIIFVDLNLVLKGLNRILEYNVSN